MRFSLCCVLMFASCTLSAVAPETEFKASGEVRLYDRTVSFDSTRVRSPQCNLSKRSDGSWGGVLAERPIDVSVTDTRISGVDFSMTRETSDATKLVITGQFQGRIYRFELDENQAMIRGPTRSVTLPGRQVGEHATVYGPLANLQLRGEAGSQDAPWPQIAFALMAMMH